MKGSCSRVGCSHTHESGVCEHCQTCVSLSPQHGLLWYHAGLSPGTGQGGWRSGFLPLFFAVILSPPALCWPVWSRAPPQFALSAQFPTLVYFALPLLEYLVSWPHHSAHCWLFRSLAKDGVMPLLFLLFDESCCVPLVCCPVGGSLP